VIKLCLASWSGINNNATEAGQWLVLYVLTVLGMGMGMGIVHQIMPGSQQASLASRNDSASVIIGLGDLAC
jgi:hypothetical protein